MYALRPLVFLASVLVSYRGPRGKRAETRAQATGRGDDAKNEALRALLQQLERGST